MGCKHEFKTDPADYMRRVCRKCFFAYRSTDKPHVKTDDLRKLVKKIETYKITQHMAPQAVNDMWLSELKKLITDY